jgi:hypothetical protein
VSQRVKEFAFQLMINEYPDFRGDHDWNAYAERMIKAGYGDVRPLLAVLHSVLISSAPALVKEQVEKVIKEYGG